MPQFTKEEEQMLVDQISEKAFLKAERYFQIGSLLNNVPQTLSPTEASRLFGRSRATLDKWARLELITKVDTPGKPLFITRTLVEFLGLNKKMESNRLLEIVKYLAA